MNGSLEDNFDVQERVLNALRDLPDKKVSSNRVRDHVLQLYDDSETNLGEINEAIQDLVLLGEVELCQERGTGGRVWLKRRETPDNQSDSRLERQLVSSVWRGYTAKNYRDRTADRLFMTQEQAMEHLGESVVVDPDDYQRVPYLEDVWYVEREGTFDAEGGVTVVRREPIYSLVEQGR